MFPTILLFALSVMQVPSTPSATADPCPDGRIEFIFIDNHSIFDPASIPDDDRVRWAYQVTNRLHVRTRPRVIRDELLFRVGDCYDRALLRESARALREFRFIADVDVFSVAQPDGSRHVVVDTRDEWTTKTALAIRFDEGIQFDGASIVEENFVGRGISIGAFHLQRDARRETGGLLEVPRVGRTAWDARIAGSSTLVGTVFDQALLRPFNSERPGTAIRQSVHTRHDLYTYVYAEGTTPAASAEAFRSTSVTHIVVPVRQRRLELGVSHRLPDSEAGVVLGGGISYESVYPGAATDIERVRDGDFHDREPAPAEIAAEAEGQLGARRAFRLGVSAGVRQLEFTQRRGLDAVAGTQDLPVGREVVATVGRSIGSTGPDRPHDVHARLDVFRGGDFGHTLGFVHLTAEGRREAGRPEAAWRDILLEAQALTYWHPDQAGSPTLVVRGAMQAGWRTDAPFQLTLGGADGVRGYTELQIPGGRRILGSVEGRWPVPNPAPRLLDLAGTVFVDAGRMWKGDAPFGLDSGARTSAGVGLRVGFPAGSGSVIRFDVALPLEGDLARRPILRISAREWIGLLNDTRNLRLLDSRRSGLSKDYTGVARDRWPPG
jgi:hypothetical protein